ncbi:MAG: hypothetical protein DID90_2727554528 [Candidatus Nitrotoga sp. LAW]|nr:MAG: hypothetical protein DID90_2727554528 [Candidatus Nitrotoga sp. LAW]
MGFARQQDVFKALGEIGFVLFGEQGHGEGPSRGCWSTKSPFVSGKNNIYVIEVDVSEFIKAGGACKRPTFEL